MASTGNVFPGTGASVDRAGSTAWTNPGNVVSDNGSDTTAAVPTDYLVCSNFGFSIPAGATILGVTVRVEASETGTGNSNYVPQLISDTTPTLIGSPKSAVTVNGTTKVISTNGGAADLWGATLTPALVNDAGFGVAIWSTDTTNTLAIDFVTIAIEYLEPVPDDDENADWSGLSLSDAGPALARAAAAVALAAGICLGLQQQTDELPAQPPAVLDDGYWETPSAPLVPAMVRLWYGDDETPTQGVVDEGYWQYGQIRQSLIWLQSGDEEVVPQPAVALDEGEWQPPKPASVTFAGPLWYGEDEVAPVALDEGEWSPPLPVPRPVPQPALGDDELGAPAAAFAGDDDSLQQVLITRSVVRFWFDGSEAAVVAVPPLGVDEEGWQPQAPLVRAVVRLWHGEDERVTAAAPLGIDEDGWTARVVVAQPRLTQWWTSHETSLEPVPSEDYWHELRSFPARVVVWLWHGEDERVTPPAALGVDEEGWQPRAVPGRTSVRLWHGEDERVTPPPAPPEEAYWLLPQLEPRLVPAMALYLGEPDDTPALTGLLFTTRPLRARIGGTPLVDTHTRIGGTPVVDTNERIGPEVGAVAAKRIGEPAK